MGQSTFVQRGTLGVVVAIALAALGAAQATAADITEGFATAANMKSGVGSAASMVLLGDLSWGSYNAGPNWTRSRNSFLEFQTGSNVQGTYAFTRFGTSLELDKIEVDKKSGWSSTMRFLVRDAGAGNKWYASQALAFTAGVAQYSPSSYQWYEVTTGGAEMSTGTGGTWAPLVFSSTGVAWPGLTIDGAGFYVETPDTVNSCQVYGVTWKAPIAGAVTIPDLAGLTEGAATSTLTSLGLVVTTPSLSAHSDEYAAGLVTTSTPGAGIEVAPGSAVQLTVSTGPAQMWDWSPIGSSLDFGDESNWTLAGSAVGTEAVFAKPIDIAERLRFYRGDTATMGAAETMTAQRLLLGNNGKVIVDGGALTVNGAISSIGSISFGAATSGTLEVRSGSVVFGNLNVGVNDTKRAAGGTLRISGGGVSCGNLNICQPGTGGGTVVRGERRHRYRRLGLR
ncbi:MAG: PASTA domain-containing protein [Candidatus Sumerlaeota bacterium]|nr:PASTA domain-containing protein [Candidatus Sumerlaeota bacterium]